MIQIALLGPLLAGPLTQAQLPAEAPRSVVRLTRSDQLNSADEGIISAFRLDCGESQTVTLVLDAEGVSALDARGIDYELVSADLDREIEEERQRLHRGKGRPSGRADWDAWFSDFKTFPQIEARLEELDSIAPDISERFALGTTHEGQTIHGFRVSSTVQTEKKVVLVTGTQHAREWASPMVMMCLVDALVRGYGNDADITRYIDQLEFVFVPVVNPDGYAYSWQGERLWRKNRRPGGGVDLNRNWAQEWGLGSSGGSMNSETYPGSAAFSEPETAAIRDFAEQNEIVAFVDYHSPVAMVLYPFAYTSEAGPQEDRQRTWAEAMAAAISDTHGEPHHAAKPGQGRPSGGLAQDWFAAQRNALAWTVEVRGQGSSGSGFILPADEIDETCDENLAGFLDLAERLTEEFGVDDDETSGGDDTASGSEESESDEGSESASASTASSGGDEVGATDDSEDSTQSAGVDEADDQSCACATPGNHKRPHLAWLLGLTAMRWWPLRRRL